MTDSAKCYCVMKLGGRVVRAPVPSRACPIHHDKCKVCWGTGKIKGWSGEEDETCPECAGSGAAVDSTGGADARIRQLEQYGHYVKQDLATVEERCAELSRNLEESISIGARAETARIEAERNADRLATEKLGLLDEVKLARVGWGAMVDALQLRNDVISELRSETEKLRGELAVQADCMQRQIDATAEWIALCRKAEAQLEKLRGTCIGSCIETGVHCCILCDAEWEGETEKHREDCAAAPTEKI